MKPNKTELENRDTFWGSKTDRKRIISGIQTGHYIRNNETDMYVYIYTYILHRYQWKSSKSIWYNMVVDHMYVYIWACIKSKGPRRIVKTGLSQKCNLCRAYSHGWTDSKK